MTRNNKKHLFNVFNHNFQSFLGKKIVCEKEKEILS